MGKRNISISTAFDYNIAIDRQIEMIAKSGFNYISLGENEGHSTPFEIKEAESCSTRRRVYRFKSCL